MGTLKRCSPFLFGPRNHQQPRKKNGAWGTGPRPQRTGQESNPTGPLVLQLPGQGDSHLGIGLFVCATLNLRPTQSDRGSGRSPPRRTRRKKNFPTGSTSTPTKTPAFSVGTTSTPKRCAKSSEAGRPRRGSRLALKADLLAAVGEEDDFEG